MSNGGDQSSLFDPRTCDALDLIEHIGDEVPAENRWPKTLAEIFRVHEAYNLRRGMTSDRAALDARDRTILLGEYLGGRMLYLPKGEALRTAVLHALIWRDFRGHNHEELAAKYQINIVSIYEILRAQRALSSHRMQGRLFEG
jgi:Mor family transcriptional regulator